MQPTTQGIIRAALKADPSLSVAERGRLIAVLRRSALPNTAEPKSPATPPRLLRRAEVARRLSCSLRTVDKLPISKVKLPGRKRAAGFLEADINALLVREEAA